MLRISWQSLRARRASLAGAFIAIWLAVTMAFATGSLMAGALSAPGPGRFAAADTVVRAAASVTLGHGDDADSEDVVPAPRLPASVVGEVASVPGVAHATGDVAFPLGAWNGAGDPVRLGGADRLEGHGWASGALTPYRLRAGRAPGGPHEVVADARLGVRPGAVLRVTAPGGRATFRVSGVVDGHGDQAAVFFSDETAAALSGAPTAVNAVAVRARQGTAPSELRAQLGERLGSRVDVLDRAHAADADAGDTHAESRITLVAIFGTLGGIAGIVALIVVAGTFALAMAQRRREMAVLSALGATAPQIRRLVAGEALIVSLVASGLGLLAGGPLADLIARLVVEHGVAPQDFEPVRSPIPLVAALGLGVVVAQVAVFAAARRAARVRPAEALREAAVAHARPGVIRTLAGLLAIGGGATLAIVFAGEAAAAFAILGAMLSATGVALLGRWLLGFPAAALAWPLRAAGATGLLASTALAANRWRTAAIASPVLLVAMLVATQGVIEPSERHNTERVTAARVTADHVVRGTDDAPLPVSTAAEVRRLPGVQAATGVLPTTVFLLDDGLTGWDAPWDAAGADLAHARRTLDLRVLRGDPRDVGADRVAISEAVAAEGHADVGDTLHARMADTQPMTLRVVAVYERAAGLGHVVMDPAVARRHAGALSDAAVFVDGGARAARSLDAYARTHTGVEAMDRAAYLGGLNVALDSDGTWGVWLVIGMSVGFALLAVVNVVAMATGERRHELATIRLLGGTPGQITRMIGLELAPTVAVGLLAGAAVAALALMRVPSGVRGFPLVVPVTLTGALIAGAALLALVAGAVAARLAMRATPAAAMRGQE